MISLQDKDQDGRHFPLQEIDPFTFYAVFNRGITDENRKAILADIKDFFGLIRPIPEDFAGIPVASNMSSWFFSRKAERKAGDIAKLWQVFRLALRDNARNDDAFWAAFDAALEVRRVNLNLTMGLFWIRPYTFLSLDSVNCQFLGIKLPSKLSARYYRELLEEVSKQGRSFPELSLAAWQATLQSRQGKEPKASGTPAVSAVDYTPVEDSYLDMGAEGDEEDETERNPEYSFEQMVADTGLDQFTLARWVRAIERKKQAILYGPPGTGKTFLAERLASYLVSGGNGLVELVQFHPAYTYEDFIQGIRPESDGDRLRYPLKPGRFLNFIVRARERTGKSVLIIDEINRANLARVFGELMYLLEYRDREIPLAGGGTLRIPDNVRIIGTMNTADRSIALVDHALRRRFAFLALWPDEQLLRYYHQREGTGFPVDGLIQVLRRLNNTIGDRHYAVGISYFLRKDLSTQLEDIWRMEIEPYLEEYFFDQPEKVDAFRWERIQREVLPNA
uniref:AAA family ATPase n=2 Tax=Litorilinea aerophila TaxID=1204385 RepID=A0A540VA47_9CHLR